MRRKKGFFDRVMAWILVCVMVITAIHVPQKEAEAASNVALTIGQFPTSAQNNQYDIYLSGIGYGTIQDLVNAGYNSLSVTISLESYVQGGTGSAGVQLYYAYGETYTYETGGWKNLGDIGNGTVTLTLPLSSSLSGVSDTLQRFGVQFCNVDTVTAQVISAELVCSGSTSGTTGGGTVTDTTTDKNLNVDYNYAKLLQESLYFYDANMCGDKVSETTGFSWRGDCHTKDKEAVYEGQPVDVSGGFHDAGDHVKFGLPQGYAASTLALSYYEFGDAFDELKQTAHYKTIMDYFCDYFVNCAIYSDNVNKTGTLKAFCYNVGDGSDSGTSGDHQYWGKPEIQPDCNRSTNIYFTDSSMTATDIVCSSACALALHAYNFPSDSKSEKYLQVAKDLFDYADTHEKKCYVVQQYQSSSWQDDYCCAAAALYVATSESSYKTKYDQYKSGLSTGWCLCWNNTDAIAATLMKDWSTVYEISTYGTTNTQQGFKFINSWGSARYNTSQQFTGLVYDKNMQSDNFSTWATGQMKYLLGNNDNKRCFVVGYNENSSKYPHHRAASNSSDASITNESGHHILLGALVGGPSDVNDSYEDNQGNYNTNEVALDYNATLVGAAAGLYLLHKDDNEISKSLETEANLQALGVTRYGEDYSGSSATPESGVSYVITYDTNGGNLLNTQSKNLKDGEKYGNLPEPTRTGYNFIGWYDSAVGGTKITSETIFGDKASKRIYAHWEIINYSITYNVAGGENSSQNPSTYTVEDAFSFSEPQKSGNSFVGWYDNSSCTGEVVTSIKKGTTGNISLYAKWTQSVSVYYTTHVQTYGWQGNINDYKTWKSNGAMAGTSGESKRLEGIKIKIDGNSNLGIEYRTHVQSYGWENRYRQNGEMSGTSAQAKRLEAISIRLTGTDASKYDVYYRVHAQSYGWLGWAKNGENAGTAAQSKRLEGIEIQVLRKGEKPSEGIIGYSYIELGKKANNTKLDGMVNYRTHVQTYGNQSYVYDGSVSGTFGEAKRLEGIQITLNNEKTGVSGGITYRTYVQTYGWLPWTSDDTYNGTTKQSKRMEAIEIKLTGEMAQKYDVYYRVHSQTYGWLGWAKNGDTAGTSGLSKRLEGIQIVLVPKNGMKPGHLPGKENMVAYIKG